jgi:prephenate dehydrogenase
MHSVGIVGHGSFGSLLETLIKRFAPEVSVRIYSSRHEPDQEHFFSLQDTAQCDAVILAVPIKAFEETVLKVLPFLGKDTILVDVATVKVHTVEILKRLASDRRYLATHPMFGPESYEKTQGEVKGYRVVMSASTLSAGEDAAIADFLRQCGFEVVTMPPEQHDEHLAETLFLTHFIGQIVERGKFNRTEIDTASFGFLMNAVESVRKDTALFQDVYRYNPFCEETLKRFEIAEDAVHELLKSA